ncbi:MAG: efflux RND transporter periplasmic adaptor subunit [Chthonomonadales bacterium]|nr:efflux RND transporter periplasmic adaptor subunit [Chthonomonadales bacterium]
MTSITPRAALLVAIIGFALGAAATVFLVSRGRPAAEVIASAEASEHAEHDERPEEGHEEGHEEDVSLHLDPTVARRMGVRAEPARWQQTREGITVPGTVEVAASRVARITPPVAGKVVRIHARLGQSVRRGQPLVTLDSFEVAQAHAAVRQATGTERQMHAQLQTARAEVGLAQAAVSQARAEVEQARARLQSASSALASQKELAQAGAFSQAPLQTAQSELAGAQSELIRAETELQTHTVALHRAERLYREGIVSRAEMEQAQLEHRHDQTGVDAARARVGIARKALEREQKVFGGDLLSKQAVQAAEGDLREARAGVVEVQQRVRRAEQDVRRARKEEAAAAAALRGAQEAAVAARQNLFALEGAGHVEGAGGALRLDAPFDGTVGELTATIGEAVERSSVLLVLENLSAVVVHASVPEKDIARVKAGNAVSVTVPAYPGERFPGVVESLSTRVDPKTRALAVRCLVSNRLGRLRPEMFAQVELATGIARRALLVPQEAVVEVEGAASVFVEDGGAFRSRRVTLGSTVGGRTELLSGVRPGERVVTAGAFLLKSEAQKDELGEEGHAH